MEDSIPELMAEVRRYSHRVHRLRPGADAQMIRDAEERLGRPLPSDLRQLLAELNGAVLFQNQPERITLFGIGPDSPGAGIEIADIVAQNGVYSRLFGKPDDLLIFALCPQEEDALAVDLQEGSRVVELRRYDWETRFDWSSPTEWLWYRMRVMQNRCHYDGAQRDW